MKLAGRKVTIEFKWREAHGGYELSKHIEASIYPSGEEFAVDLTRAPFKTFPTIPEAVEWVEQQLGVKT